MTEIKTPNWRLSNVSPQSTGHHYQLKDRRTSQVVYFDSVTVFDGGLNEVKLYRDHHPHGEGDRSRAGILHEPDQLPTIMHDALLHLDEGGKLSDLGDRYYE
jgi:hypothetical protein